MVQCDDIVLFIREFSKKDYVIDETDLFDGAWIKGDTFTGLIQSYAKKFEVDISNYLWYFHTDDIGDFSVGGIFFKPPFKQVERIPITPLLLTEFANKKKWDLQYPEHAISEKRYDILINRIFIALVLAYFGIVLLKKFMFKK